jgi:hypothetical protein
MKAINFVFFRIKLLKKNKFLHVKNRNDEDHLDSHIFTLQKENLVI